MTANHDDLTPERLLTSVIAVAKLLTLEPSDLLDDSDQQSNESEQKN